MMSIKLSVLKVGDSSFFNLNGWLFEDNSLKYLAVMAVTPGSEKRRKIKRGYT